MSAMTAAAATPDPFHVTDHVHARLVRQLQSDDAALAEADRALRQAQADYEIAGKKYAVQRDVTIRRLMFDPYAKGSRVIVHDDFGGEEIEFESRGRFRFIHMDVGDAAMVVLTEVTEPLYLESLVLILRRGGISGTTAGLTRAVNASLINKAGVGKTDDGRYFRKEDETDDDPLPF